MTTVTAPVHFCCRPRRFFFFLFICAIYTAPDFVGLLRALTTLIATTKVNDSDLYSSSAAGRRYLMHRIFWGGGRIRRRDLFVRRRRNCPAKYLYSTRGNVQSLLGVLNYVSRHFSKNLINLNSSILMNTADLIHFLK